MHPLMIGIWIDKWINRGEKFRLAPFSSSKPAWLNILVYKGYEIFCGFDNEKTGYIFANKMIRFFPTVKRLRPTKHDWNEILVPKYRMS